eukprot:145320-Chlamydomonas_euryale.AAC.1
MEYAHKQRQVEFIGEEASERVSRLRGGSRVQSGGMQPVLCSTVRTPLPLTVRPVRCTVRYGRYGRYGWYGHPDSGKGWEAISTPEYAYLPCLMRRYGELGERAMGVGTQGCS